MEADDWRRQLSPHARQVVVNHIVNEIKPSLPSYLEKELQKIAARFEEKVYGLAKDKTAYLSRIRMKLRSIKESSTTALFNSSSNPSCSTEIPLDPVSPSNQSLALQQHSPLNQASSEVHDAANLPTTMPYGCGLTQAPMPNFVGQNCELQDVSGNMQKSAENPLGQRMPSGHSGNYERCAQGRQCSTQAISRKNQEECLYFQQDSYLKLQKSTQSVLKSSSQTAARQLQQSQLVPLIQDNLPTISEQTSLPSWQEEKLMEEKLVSYDVRQNQLIGQQNCVSDLQQRMQQKLPCQLSDFQSLQSKSPIPEQQLMPQSQPAKMKQMLNLSQPYEQQRFQKSGHMNSLSVIKQEEIYQQAETSRIKYLMEVKKMCQKTINLLQKQDSVPQESKSRLSRILKELNDPKCKISIEKLDLIKRQTNCMLQLSMPRKPASSHGQISSNVHSMKHLLQQPSQTPQLLPLLAQKESELQSVISQNSAITTQQDNVTNLQDDTPLLSFEHAAAQQNIMKTQQNLTKSDSGQGNSVKSLLQVSLRSLQIPVSTLHQPNIDSMVSQNLRNALEPNGSSLNFSSVLPQHMHSKQKMEQLHVTQQKPKQNFQQDQIWQQIMPVKQEGPEQKQILSGNERPQHQLNEVNDVKVRLGITNEMQHHINEVNNLKVRSGTAVKTGIQHKSVGPCQNPRSGVPLSSSLPRLPHSASPQTSQCYLQATRQNFRTLCAKVGSSHHSLNSNSIVPLSTPLALSAEPQFSEELSSNAFSLTNAGTIGHQQTTDRDLLSQFIVGTPGISLSPLLAKSENPDYITSNASAIGFVKSGEAEQPLGRLVRVVNLMSPKVLTESVSQIGSVVCLLDSMAGSLPLYGSRGPVGEDLGAMSKTDPLARYFSRNCSAFAMGKMKRSMNACPMDETTLAVLEKSDLESPAISHIKKPRVEVKHALLEEIREINERLVDTVVDISDEHANSTAHGTDGSTGIIVKCSFSTMAVIPNLNSQKALAQISPIQTLQLLVPTNYPYCSPILLEKLPGDVSETHEDLSVKAKSRLNGSLKSLLRPMSVKQIAKTWDICARAVISEYAMQNGGGGFSSKYGTWENCLDAA